MGRDKNLGVHELARRVGCTVEAVHDYERMGILRAPKGSTGRREYSAEDARQLLLLRRAHNLGFRLYDIRVLLALAKKGTECAQSWSRTSS
jgi:DNA-binding transcriptional MerR regulator